jgi:hypothetical protein
MDYLSPERQRMAPGGHAQSKSHHVLHPGGTTLNDISFHVVKPIGKDLEINGSFAYKHWKAPIYLTGQHTVTITTILLTWFPDRKIGF